MSCGWADTPTQPKVAQNPLRSQPPCRQVCPPDCHPAHLPQQGQILHPKPSATIALCLPARQVGMCDCRYLGPDYGDERKGPSEVVSAAQIPYLAKESFPLCMQASLLFHGTHEHALSTHAVGCFPGQGMTAREGLLLACKDWAASCHCVDADQLSHTYDSLQVQSPFTDCFECMCRACTIACTRMHI